MLNRNIVLNTYTTQLLRAPARKTGGPDSNPGPGENFILIRVTNFSLLSKYLSNRARLIVTTV